jgi:DNA-binding CsgD family transcriptional regulator
VHAFNSVAVPEGLLRQLSAPRSAFWRGLQASWQKDQQRATWLHLRDATADAEIDTLCGQGLVSAWVHGVNATHRVQPEALFVFISRGQSLPAMSCHALAFWQPYLHFAAVRALAPGADAPRPQQHPGAPGTQMLSEREIEVLAAVRQAHRNADIAVQLGISPLTVKNHLRKIMKKLGARNRTEAVAEAISLQIIS